MVSWSPRDDSSVSECVGPHVPDLDRAANSLACWRLFARLCPSSSMLFTPGKQSHWSAEDVPNNCWTAAAILLFSPGFYKGNFWLLLCPTTKMRKKYNDIQFYCLCDRKIAVISQRLANPKLKLLCQLHKLWATILFENDSSWLGVLDDIATPKTKYLGKSPLINVVYTIQSNDWIYALRKTMTVVLCTVPFIKKVSMHTKKAYQRRMELNTFECCFVTKTTKLSYAVVRL